jgi:putative membrane protein
MKNTVWMIIFALALPASRVWAADANPDAEFYRNAAEGGMAEVELGKLSQQKSSTESVKDFGAMMVADHSAANEKLKSIAARKNVKLPTSPSVSQKATKDGLQI